MRPPEALILRDVRFQNKLENEITNALIKKAPPQAKQAYLRELLFKELKARGRKQPEARRMMEDLLERAYYRSRIRTVIAKYLKK